MGTSQLTGTNFSLNEGVIEFFGVKGFKQESTWAMNLLGGSIYIETAPDSIMDIVRESITGDVRSGNDHKIAMLLLAPSQAVVFFLEGQLTREHIENATDGDGFVDIPNVEIEGYTVTVRVLGEPEYKVATADSEGTVLP